MYLSASFYGTRILFVLTGDVTILLLTIDIIVTVGDVDLSLFSRTLHVSNHN